MVSTVDFRPGKVSQATREAVAPSAMAVGSGFALGFAELWSLVAVSMVSTTVFLAILRLQGRLRWSHVAIGSASFGAGLTHLAIPWHVAPITVAVGWCVCTRRLKVLETLRSAFPPRRPEFRLVVLSLVVIAFSSAFMYWYLSNRLYLSTSMYGIPLLLMIPLAALVNAATEEAIFRGALFSTLAGWPTWAVIFLSGAVFGLSHWSSGIPSGPIGALAAALFGLALASLRASSRSLVLPITSHFVVNVVILTSLLT